MQRSLPVREVEGGRLSGLPVNPIGTLDSNHKGQQTVSHFTRILCDPACRRTATALLRGDTLAHQQSATISIPHTIICSMLPSLLLMTSRFYILASAFNPHRADRPLRGVKRDLSISAGDAATFRSIRLDAEEIGFHISVTAPIRSILKILCGSETPGRPWFLEHIITDSSSANCVASYLHILALLWFLPVLPIVQNHGIDDLATLHAALGCKLRLADAEN